MTLQERYRNALDSFVSKVKDDPSVIAVILAGSLAYDTVAEGSDIDLTMVVRDQKLETKSFFLVEDDIVLSLSITTLTDFKRGTERSLGGGIMQSLTAKSVVVYTKDESIKEFVDEMRTIGHDDAALSFYQMSDWLLGLRHKINKWLTVKSDISYAQLYILKAADAIASMEVCRHLEPTMREAILRASELNPSLMERFYATPISRRLTRVEIEDTLKAIDDYIVENFDFFVPQVIDYMSDGEVKTIAMLGRHFRAPCVYTMDFLAERGIIERVTETVRITPKGRKCVEEAAYVYTK